MLLLDTTKLKMEVRMSKALCNNDFFLKYRDEKIMVCLKDYLDFVRLVSVATRERAAVFIQNFIRYEKVRLKKTTVFVDRSEERKLHDKEP